MIINETSIREAERIALQSVYKNTINNAVGYHSTLIIKRLIPYSEIYGYISPDEIPNLLKKFVDEGLVLNINTATNGSPDDHFVKIRNFYKANLDKKDEIEKIIEGKI